MASGSDVRRFVRMGKSKTSLSLVGFVVGGVLCLITSNVRFGYQRSTSLLFSYYSSSNIDNDDETINATSLSLTTAEATLSPIGSDGHQRFYILPTPEVTDWLLGNNSEAAHDYYERALNEDQAELWLYRSLQNHPSRTLDPEDAGIFVICGCLHLNYHLQKKLQGTGRPSEKNSKKRGQHPQQSTVLPSTVVPTGTNNSTSSIATFNAKEFAQQIQSRIVDKTRPHLIAIPTTNPGTSRLIGVRAIVKALQAGGVDQNLWSLGFERNTYWQGLPPDRIIPIPYVVRPPNEIQKKTALRQGIPSQTATSKLSTNNGSRTPDFIFYAGDRRIHAQEWSGCDRSMVDPLAMEMNMDIRLIDSKHKSNSKLDNNSQRLTQEEYNYRMHSSEYCLILCGDSPTSRSLTSAIVHGCIPLRVGSRLRGLCEPPCHKGWGWTISGDSHPHLPFSTTRVNWTLFPEVDEAKFIKNPA